MLGDADTELEALVLGLAEVELEALVLGDVDVELDTLALGEVDALVLTELDGLLEGVPSEAEAEGDVDAEADTLVDGELDFDDETLILGVPVRVSACVNPSTSTETIPAPEAFRHKRVFASNRKGSREKSNGQNVAAAPPTGPIRDFVSAPLVRPWPISTVIAAATATYSFVTCRA